MDIELPLDIGSPDDTVAEDELGVERYVVLHGFNVGVMDKLHAILATVGIDGTCVIKMSDAAAAHRRMRDAMAAGNKIAIVGTSSAEERMAYTAGIRARLLSRLNPPTPPVRRSDSIQVPASLRARPSSMGRTSHGSYRIKAEAQDEQSFAPEGWVPPNAYTPPATAGLEFRPGVPYPDVLSGRRSQHPWYVAWQCRAPGIYKSWDDVEAANDGAERKLIAPGFRTYKRALEAWVARRGSGEIKMLQ